VFAFLISSRKIVAGTGLPRLWDTVLTLVIIKITAKGTLSLVHCHQSSIYMFSCLL